MNEAKRSGAEWYETCDDAVLLSAPKKDEAMILFHSFVFICGCLLDGSYDILDKEDGGAYQ